ncbi:MAG: addiction module protein, partial [Deltaproteobacteria bacterium]|nr:addiction module protein [Deltaproteobacteria bacterium]
VDEIERRVEEIRSGSAKTVPGEKVMKRLRLKVRRARLPGRK